MEARGIVLGKSVAAQLQAPELGHPGQEVEVGRGECDVLVGQGQRAQARQVLADGGDAEQQRRRRGPRVVRAADLQLLKVRQLSQQALQHTVMLRPTGQVARCRVEQVQPANLGGEVLWQVHRHIHPGHSLQGQLRRMLAVFV